MNRSKLVAYVLAGWLAIEVIAFVLVVQFLGLLAAIILGVATTLLGLADIRRLLLYLRSRLAKKQRVASGGNLLDGSLEAIGSILLILPGFASDLVGLALKAPSIRAGLLNRLRQEQLKRNQSQMIDLSPGEWKSLDDRRKGARKRKK